MHSFALSFAATFLFGAISSALPIIPQIGTEVTNIAGDILPAVAAEVTSVKGVVTDAAGNVLNIRVIPQVGAEVTDIVDAIVPSVAAEVTDIKGVVTDAVGNVLNTRASISPVSVVITEAQTKLTPLLQKISAAKAESDVAAALSPIATQMQTILADAATEIKGLVGQPMSIVMGTTGGVTQTTVPELAQLTGDLMTNVIGTLGEVKTYVEPKVETVVTDVMSGVVTSLADLTTNVSTLVSGLVAELIPFIASIIPVVEDLNLTEVIQAVGLN